MRSRPLTLLLVASAAAFAAPCAAQEVVPSIPSRAATSLAHRFLRTIDTSFTFLVSPNDTDYVVAGTSRRGFGVRLLVIVGGAHPRVAWDDDSLWRHDPDFELSSLQEIDADADGPGNYVVTTSGCARHECADGDIGFAVYASRTHRLYTADVDTRSDGSYEVSYRPRAGLPRPYQLRLIQMMCSYNGITRPSTLPVKCPSS